MPELFPEGALPGPGGMRGKAEVNGAAHNGAVRVFAGVKGGDGSRV